MNHRIASLLLGATLPLACSADAPRDAGVDARIVRPPAADVPADVEVAAPDVSPCLRPATPSGTDGPCGCSTDCEGFEDGVLCDTESFAGVPRGRCLRVCASVADCGGGYRCFRSGDAGVMQCNQACTTNEDCGEARYCFAGYCRLLCQRDADCNSGNCNRWTARCDPAGAAPREAGLTGEQCLRNEDCRSNICLSNACASPCAVSAQFCPEGETCVGSMLNDAGVCYQNCRVSADCRRAGARCTTVSVSGRTARVCQ